MKTPAERVEEMIKVLNQIRKSMMLLTDDECIAAAELSNSLMVEKS